jgi:hypothetical protein
MLFMHVQSRRKILCLRSDGAGQRTVASVATTEASVAPRRRSSSTSWPSTAGGALPRLPADYSFGIDLRDGFNFLAAVVTQFQGKI